MKFWIIIPTCNRYNLLKRSINSVLNQTYTNFELIIIDDSTNEITFKNFKNDFIDDRIKYIKNKNNSWVNFSRNIWLNNLSNDVEFVFFLDDDDYFNINTLLEAKRIIDKNPNQNWFISNRLNITKIKQYNQEYNYIRDYLFWNKIQWDVTHCIRKKSIWNIRFSKYIKQAQEWLFFIELAEKNLIYTYDFDSTISEYLEWWLSDTNWYKILFWKVLWVLEFIFVRKVSLKTKIYFIKYFIKKVLWF